MIPLFISPSVLRPRRDRPPRRRRLRPGQRLATAVGGPLDARLEGRCRRPLRLHASSTAVRRDRAGLGLVSVGHPGRRPRRRRGPGRHRGRCPRSPAPTRTSFLAARRAPSGLVVTAARPGRAPATSCFGLVVLAVTAVEWAVRAWAERATGDPEVNRGYPQRLIAPFEIPVLAVLVIAFLVARALPGAPGGVRDRRRGGVRIARRRPDPARRLIVLTRPQQTKRLATVLLLVLTLAVLGGGIAGVVTGDASRAPPRGAGTHGGGEGSRRPIGSTRTPP